MDITKCSGKDCSLKDTCYRYTAKSESESYFVEPPIKDGKCSMYWGEESNNILNQLKNILKGQKL